MINSPFRKCFHLSTGHEDRSGESRSSSTLAFQTSALDWVSATPRTLSTPVKDPVPIVQEAGWAPVLVWTGAQNIAPIGFRTSDRPARSQSLYRLNYPAQSLQKTYLKDCLTIKTLKDKSRLGDIIRLSSCVTSTSSLQLPLGSCRKR
jgi:hypothetical protein